MRQSFIAVRKIINHFFLNEAKLTFISLLDVMRMQLVLKVKDLPSLLIYLNEEEKLCY